MLRSRHKQIVFIDKFDNDVFEQAIFILKPQSILKNKKGNDYALKEAKKIVANYALRYDLSNKESGGNSQIKVLIKEKNQKLIWVAAAVAAVGGMILGALWFF